MKRMFNPWHTLAVLAVATTLAACEPSAPSPKLDGPAPAPAPAAGPGTEAVHGLGADAATVAASVAKADAPHGDGTTQATASPLAELRSYVGTYPSDSNVSFLEQGVLAERLKQLLGKDYPTLLANMRTVGPLTEDRGRWFITGNRPHEGGAEAAAIVVDAAQNAVRVWMLHEGATREFLDPQGASVPWPQDVQTLMGNHAAAPKG